jgi:hypothetical protein
VSTEKFRFSFNLKVVTRNVTTKAKHGKIKREPMHFFLEVDAGNYQALYREVPANRKTDVESGGRQGDRLLPAPFGHRRKQGRTACGRDAGSKKDGALMA